jgi:hypothetical protein
MAECNAEHSRDFPQKVFHSAEKPAIAGAGDGDASIVEAVAAAHAAD